MTYCTMILVMLQDTTIPDSVSDVYITSITARWKAAKQECNDKSALPFKEINSSRPVATAETNLAGNGTNSVSELQTRG